MGKRDKQRRRERSRARKAEQRRSFSPRDAFEKVDADEAHRLGLITDELHELATEHSEPTRVTFQPTKKRTA